jgi:SH3-like domain-containing protein
MFFYSEMIENIIKSWKQKQILSGSLAVTDNDQFGFSVAMNSTGDRIIVGARYDEASGAGQDSGLAYILVSGTNGWTQQQILSGNLSTQPGDQFGTSVAINSTGDIVVIGGDYNSGTVQTGEGGRAYIFISGTNGWSQQDILKSIHDGWISRGFASALAINSIGNRIVVGAKQDYIQRDGGSWQAGVAHVFTSGTTGWIREHILSGSLAINNQDYFGTSVSMNSTGDRIIVGAPGDEKGGGSDSSGLAYVFVSGTGGWTEHILSGSLATDPDDGFGYSVAMNSAGDRVVVGAPFDERSGGSGSSGLSYVFVSGTTGWIQQHVLSGSLTTDANDNFGFSVDVNSAGDRIVIGARETVVRSAVGGTGQVYIFDSGSTGWSEKHILTGTLATNIGWSSYPGDQFGFAVAMNSSGDCVVIGAPTDEAIGGSTPYEGGTGLAYVFNEE